MASPARGMLGALCIVQIARLALAQTSPNPDQSAIIEQSRLLDRSGVISGAKVNADGMVLPNAESETGDDSFGVQQVLKRQERIREWIVAGDASLFYVSNVALTRDHTISDGLGIVDASVSWGRKIDKQLQLQLGVRASMFRYFDTTEFDFQNVGAGVGLAWAPDDCFGIGFFARYDFTELIDRDGDEILNDHEWTIGGQKTFVFGRSHALTLGVVGMGGISDPFSSQRDQAGVFAGYHLQLTRKIDMDVLYRFGCYFYNEDDRIDANHVFSANVAYHLTNWASLAAYLSFGNNRSNHGVFDYDVFTGGGGLGFSVRF